MDYYRMRKIARSRGNPNICKYTRSFDFRKTDTKIMREIFNLVQEWTEKYDGISFPVQAEDSFEKLYQMDDEDLEDILLEATKKLGISIENTEKNPYFNKVETVKDLVLFLNFQAKLKCT